MDGLDDVVAAETVLSDVDGAAGRLVIRGHALVELSGHVAFEEAAHILLHGLLADLPDVAGFRRRLGLAREQVFDHVAALDAGLAALPPIDVVRALMARLPDGDDLDCALRLIAGPAVFTAATIRARRGEAPLAPDPKLGHAADALRMIQGATPSPAASAALDAYLVTIIDHGLNASTFAARVTASTLAGLTSAVLAGVSALKGPLHGGAPGPVIEMLDEIGSPECAVPWLEASLDRGERLMGFGHRIYRAPDAASACTACFRQSARGSRTR